MLNNFMSTTVLRDLADLGAISLRQRSSLVRTSRVLGINKRSPVQYIRLNVRCTGGPHGWQSMGSGPSGNLPVAGHRRQRTVGVEEERGMRGRTPPAPRERYNGDESSSGSSGFVGTLGGGSSGEPFPCIMNFARKPCTQRSQTAAPSCYRQRQRNKPVIQKRASGPWHRDGEEQGACWHRLKQAVHTAQARAPAAAWAAARARPWAAAAATLSLAASAAAQR